VLDRDDFKGDETEITGIRLTLDHGQEKLLNSAGFRAMC
jgi:hypothetical protein